MVMWIIIVSLLIIGLVLFIIEVVFIPGTTVVGILGLVFMIAGILISYRHFGEGVGFYVMLTALILTAASLVYSFKSGAWNRFALKGSMKSKVNEGATASLQIGDEGITISSLRPSGKAEFNNKIFEVRTGGQYLEPNQRIRIVQLDMQQITVEPVSSLT